MKIEKKSHIELIVSKPSVTKIRSRKRNPIYLLLDNVRSRYNVGAVFRTCDASLVAKIFLCGITPCPPHKDIDKSALGATDVVPWEHCPDAEKMILRLKKKKIKVIALELTKQSKDYSRQKYAFPICLVVGSETEGVSQKVLNLCDRAIDIPMHGRATSLNVATACGIAIYEILRQYRKAFYD